MRIYFSIRRANGMTRRALCRWRAACAIEHITAMHVTILGPEAISRHRRQDTRSIRESLSTASCYSTSAKPPISIISRGIFITHLHPDHAVFTSAPDIGRDVKIYVPEPTKKAPNAHVIARTVRIDSYRVTPVPTIHSHRTRSVGYVVENKGRSFFYSSDMVLIEPQYHERLRGVEVVITEGSYIRKGGLVRIDRDSGEPYGHAAYLNLVEFFRPFARCIVITHFGSWFYKDIDASVRKVESLGDGVRVVAAYDGLTIDI
jgi:ribonuclease BN (tRNA processing enzyme)